MIEQIVSYLGLLGIGGICGAFVKYFLDEKSAKKKMLFDARLKAYAGLTGRMLNHFQEPDLTSLPEELRVAKTQHIFSEAMLLSSDELIDAIGQYKNDLHQYHNGMRKIILEKRELDEDILKQHRELAEKAINIHKLMRKDLFID